MSLKEGTFFGVKEGMADSLIKNQVSEQWCLVRKDLRNEFGESAFSSWLAPMAIGGLASGRVKMFVPTRFMKEWILKNYSARIQSIWQEHNPEIKEVCFEVKASCSVDVGGGVKDSYGSETGLFEEERTDRLPVIASNHSLVTVSGVGEISAPLDLRYTFSNFVVGKSNEFAYAAAMRVAESKDILFNPLYLYSGVGLGKTHLMHAIAWHIKEKDPTRTVLYLSAEKFMYKFVQALRNKDTIHFKEQFRSVDVLMIDDVQFISGKDATQEEFFHTFNALIDEGKQIILSADKSPTELDGMENRLKTRLGSGLVADIHPTTYELRLGILQSKISGLGVEVPQEVIEFLASHINTNVRELEGALKRLLAHAELIGRQITLESTKEILKDLLCFCDRKVTIDEIQTKVAEYFKVRVADLRSERRERSIARPRQIAMYLAKKLTVRSLPDIGRKFDRDHTTVMHAVKKVEELMQTDSGISEDVVLLTRILNS